MTFPRISTHVKKTMYGSMHVFLYDAQANGSEQLTI